MFILESKTLHKHTEVTNHTTSTLPGSPGREVVKWDLLSRDIFIVDRGVKSRSSTSMRSRHSWGFFVGHLRGGVLYFSFY